MNDKPASAYAELTGARREAGMGPSGDSFADFITMKVITRKRVEQFGNIHGATANMVGFGQNKDLIKNLGVRIDAIRLAEIDALTEFLDCNKQKFVLELLAAGIEQAREAVVRAGLGDQFNAVLNRKIAEAGFSVEPSGDKGYWTLHHQGEPIVNARAGEQGKAPQTAGEVAADVTAS